MSILEDILNILRLIPRNSVRTILFDLDGTLIDSETTACLVVQKFFANQGVLLSPEDASFLTGRKWEAALEYLLSKHSLPLSLPEIQSLLVHEYRKGLEENLLIIPGAVEAIRSLHTHYTLGLVSGSARYDILWALNRMQVSECFKVILGAEDYAQSKPKPDGYWKAAELLSSPVESCLVFEDSPAGIESGKKAGMWVAAVTSTHLSQQNTSNAHVVIKDFTKVNWMWVRSLKFDSK